MSLILDALNKAQREREEQREPVPQLSTVHYTPPPVSARSPRRLSRKSLWAGVTVLCAVAFAGGLWLAGGKQGTENTGVQPGQALVPAPPSTEVASVPRPVEPVTPPPKVEARSGPSAVAPKGSAPARMTAKDDVAGLYQTARAPAERIQPDSGKATATVASMPEEVVAGNETASSAGARAQPGGGAATSADTAKPETEPTRPVQATPSTDALAARKDLPSLQELSWATQQGLPSIMYAEHHYGADAAARRVVINGASHQVGSQLGQGVVLEEILSDGIVLRYKSQRFKLEALNSWVNF